MVEKLDVVSNLQGLIGKKNVSGNIFERVAYGQDAIAADLPVDKIPVAVTKPNSREDVSKILGYANDHGIPVYVHGSGTSFKGSAWPKRTQSIVLDMGKLNTLEFNEDDYYFEVGAGVNQYELEKALEKKGLPFADECRQQTRQHHRRRDCREYHRPHGRFHASARSSITSWASRWFCPVEKSSKRARKASGARPGLI